MSVTTVHPEYSCAVKRWNLIRDILGNCAQKHIRTPDINDQERSAQYKADAILTNFTKLTQNGLTGLVFRKAPEIELPAEIDYLFDDASGSGINIWQFSQSAVAEVVALGRYGFLVDFVDDAKRAYIKPYAPESIINWKTRLVSGVVQPYLIVLVEDIPKESDDIFCQDVVKQYRVLRLDANDIYYQELYNQDGNLVANISVADYNDQPLNYIPFVFAGSQNNDCVVDPEPLFDMAIINRGHYQCSADLIESTFICGQPYLHLDVGETSEEEFKSNNPGGITFGSRKVLITKGGTPTLLQANPNQLVSAVMQDLIDQAASIGARLISPAGGRETAEAARIRFGSQNSALYTLTSNVGWAIEQCLEIVCRFMGANEDGVVYQLNKQFYDETADPNLIAQQIMLLDRGIIAKDDIRTYGKRTGFIDELRTNEQLDAEAEIVDPLSEG